MSWPAPLESLLVQSAVSADMLEELGADHSAAQLRQRIDEARAVLSGLLTMDHKLLLLMAADRFLAETERGMHTCASTRTQTALEQQAEQIRLARSWLDRQETKL